MSHHLRVCLVFSLGLLVTTNLFAHLLISEQPERHDWRQFISGFHPGRLR